MIILLGSAGVSFALAILEDGEGMTAFVDPAVVSAPPFFSRFPLLGDCAKDLSLRSSLSLS